MSVSSVEVAYGEGWCPRSRAVVGPMAEDEARRRHAAGDPYAVLLRAGDDRPLAELRVSGRSGHVGLLLFDAHGRRHREYAYVDPARTRSPSRAARATARTRSGSAATATAR
jgi:hypothetical protein